MTVREYINAGHPWDQLRWDVVHYHAITIVNATTATRTIPPPSGSAEWIRRETLRQEWRDNCRRLTQAHEAALAAYNARQSSPSPPVVRPPTDAAPTTLAGLLDLIGADPAERAYFQERQFELNER
jgi:hypothetical protein